MNNLEKAFSKMKAKIKISKRADTNSGDTTRNRRRDRRSKLLRSNQDYTVDVKDGKFVFDLGTSGAKVTVQQADTDDRHILINVQREVETRKEIYHGIFEVTGKRIENDKWLCGHDERDWFVAAVEGKTIWEAKQSLKPDIVKAKEMAVKPKKRQKRKNEAFRRQGEWFFIPADPKIIPANPVIHKDEPMSRPGGGKPHIVEECFRLGGTTVYAKGDQIISVKEFEALRPHQKYGFVQRQADATVFIRGYVKHPDHETIYFKEWHAIMMNTENRKRSGSTMIFLD